MTKEIEQALPRMRAHVARGVSISILTNSMASGDEPVVRKELPNGFVGTDLHERLRDGGVDELIVLGMMSNMCVDGTVRAAVDLGFDVTVVHDACAAADLAFGDEQVPAHAVHAAFMAALADAYATVLPSAELA